MSIDLVVATEISTGPTTWVSLEDEAAGYELEKTSFSDRTITAKQHSVGDDLVWLRGSVVLASAPGNVTETLAVWVTGTDAFDFDTKVADLTRWLTEQVTFQIRRTIGNSRQTWTCFASTQVRISTQQEYMVATTGLVTATITRLPDVVLESV